MSDKGKQALRLLLERYADGLELCNCRSAYYGKGWAWLSGSGKRVPSHCCPRGCEANQSIASEYIAQRACEELGLKSYEKTERIWDKKPEEDEDY